MLQIANFLVGLLVVLGCLFIVGITRERRISQKLWVILWSTISLLFALFLVVSFFMEVFLSYALGGSVGYVMAVTIHIIHHMIDEIKKDQAIA